MNNVAGFSSVWNQDLININSKMCIRGGMCVVCFSFTFPNNQNPHGFLDMLHLLTRSFLDDVMYAIKILQGLSKV